MKIYLASSWRNEYQPDVYRTLRRDFHQVYDFRNPAPGNTGFKWEEVHPDWEKWNAGQFTQALSHPVAEAGYAFDKEALDWCDCCVCLLPSGKSAHLEAGYAIGQGKPTGFLLWGQETVPELMYKLGQLITPDIGTLMKWLRDLDKKAVRDMQNFRSEP